MMLNSLACMCALLVHKHTTYIHTICVKYKTGRTDDSGRSLFCEQVFFYFVVPSRTLPQRLVACSKFSCLEMLHLFQTV